MQARRRLRRALIAASIVLAGCGGGGGGDDDAPSPQPSKQPTSALADVSVTGATLVPVAIGGGLADYRMTVANAGPDAATNVALTVSLDGNQMIGAVICEANGGATCPTRTGATMTSSG